MPRPPRNATVAADLVIHLIARLVDGRFVFDDAARHEYLARTGQALARSDWRLFGYALMSNHVHLALLAGKQPLDGWLKPLHVGMAQWVNRRSRRTNPKTLGHVFADRPTTKVHRGETALGLVSYLHRNPVRAGITENPVDCPWTSHPAYVGAQAGPRCLDIQLGLELCGFVPDETGRHAFHRAVLELDESRAVARELGGDPSHTAALRRSANEAQTPHGTVDEVITRCAQALGLSREEVCGTARTREIAAARRIALAAWQQLGGAARPMARALGITDGAASHRKRRRAGAEVEARFATLIAAEIAVGQK
jgi:REP element-mobilizing transposase RayT